MIYLESVIFTFQVGKTHNLLAISNIKLSYGIIMLKHNSDERYKYIATQMRAHVFTSFVRSTLTGHLFE